MTGQLHQDANFIVYTAPNGDVQLSVVLQDAAIWRT